MQENSHFKKQSDSTPIKPKKKNGVFSAETLNGKNVPITAFHLSLLGKGKIYNPLYNRKQRRAAAKSSDPLNNRKVTSGRVRYRQKQYGRWINLKVLVDAQYNCKP